MCQANNSRRRTPHAVHQTSQQKPVIEMRGILARDTATLDQREQRRDKIKKAVALPGFYSTGWLSYLAVNMLYSSRDRKNELEGDSEIIRAAIPTICLGYSAQRARLFPSQVQRVRPTLGFRELDHPCHVLQMQGCTKKPQGWGCCPESRRWGSCLGQRDGNRKFS